MDYSNENFETFQTTLREHVTEDSLIWQLRDALFSEAFYGRSRWLDRMNHLPGGWLVSLYAQFLQARHTSKANQPPAPEPGQCHFLFLSARNNHTRRLYPMLRDQLADGNSRAWFTVKGVLNTIDSDDCPQLYYIACEWSRHFLCEDVFTATKLTRKLGEIFPQYLPKTSLARIRIYFIQFLAWRRFWITALGENPRMVVSTFEKSAYVKAFFHAARQLQVPRRIHWVHGLRHASIQATLATELWCMTPGDVRYFQPRVPDFCTVSVKRNPETDELVRDVGVLTPADFAGLEQIHFLFLGPGTEASYTREMRMADLAIIRKAQQELGDRIAWRFRPHPSAADRFRLELVEAGITVEEFTTGPLNEDLKWAHAVGSSWSSLLLDIRETGRPIFWVQAEIRNLGAVDELIADGIGIHIDSDSVIRELKKLTSITGKP